MKDNISQALEEFELLVRDNKITSFWVSVRNDGFLIQAVHNTLNRKVDLAEETFDSLDTFFYGVERIEYQSYDYTNLKSFINARVMLDRMQHPESAA